MDFRWLDGLDHIDLVVALHRRDLLEAARIGNQYVLTAALRRWMIEAERSGETRPLIAGLAAEGLRVALRTRGEGVHALAADRLRAADLTNVIVFPGRR